MVFGFSPAGLGHSVWWDHACFKDMALNKTCGIMEEPMCPSMC